MKVTYYNTDIVLLDIVGFSTLCNDRQLDAVTLMTTNLRQTLAIMTDQSFLKQHEVVIGFIPTGDGFYVILHPKFAGYGLLMAISLRTMLLVMNKQAGSLFSGVRAAIHLGIAIPFGDITGKQNFVGDGLNDCVRLLGARPDDSPNEGIPKDNNYIVVSDCAYQQFERSFAKSKQMKQFLNLIEFRKTQFFDIRDKHRKMHRACFVESSRSVAINPPRPPDVEQRMKRIINGG
jgi:hypothetical protein